MSNIEQQLEVATRILRLRAELAQAEAEFAGTAKAQKAAKADVPSVSARVLNIIREAGPAGVTRRTILAIIPNTEAVHSALKTHSHAKRIYSDGGSWIAKPEAPTSRVTRELRVPAVPVGLDHEVR
jgi:hypothetical protein